MDNSLYNNQAKPISSVMSESGGSSYVPPNPGQRSNWEKLKAKYEGFKSDIKDSDLLGRDVLSYNLETEKNKAGDPYEGNNIFKKISSEVKREILPAIKSLPSYFTKNMNISDFSDDMKKSWEGYMDKLKESKVDPMRTAQSTPEMNIPFDQRIKDNVRNEYQWNDDLLPYIEKASVKDVSPVVSEDYNTLHNRSLDDYSKIAGMYFPSSDTIKQLKPDILKEDESTFAHELLHGLFQRRKTTAGDNFSRFNYDWDRAREKLEGSLLPADKKTLDEMNKIDELLLESDSYPIISRFGDARSLANERFAHFGANTKNKNWEGSESPYINKYYEGIFNN